MLTRIDQPGVSVRIPVLHPLLRLQQRCGNRCVQRLMTVPRESRSKMRPPVDLRRVQSLGRESIQLDRLPWEDEMTPCPSSMVLEAIQGARVRINRAAPVVLTMITSVLGGGAAGLSRREQAAADSLRRLFGINVLDPSHHVHLGRIREVVEGMRRAINSLSPGRVRCVTQRYRICGPLDRSEAFVSSSPPVYLCVTRFEGLGGPDERARLMVHEAAHLGGAMNLAEVYSPPCSPYALSMDIGLALEHAEHYACLIRLVCLTSAAIAAEEQTREIMQGLGRE